MSNMNDRIFDYVKHLLTATRKDPKKFWRNIKTMINGDNNANLENVFINPDTGKDISYEETPSFLNNYFAQIANRVCRDNCPLNNMKSCSLLKILT